MIMAVLLLPVLVLSSIFNGISEKLKSVKLTPNKSTK